MSCLTLVAKLNCRQQDFELLQQQQQQYFNTSFLPPHITLIEPILVEDVVSYQHFIDMQLPISSINCNLQRCIVMPPQGKHKHWYSFLLPEQGFAELCQLNSDLDNNPESREYPFIPHITLGRFANKQACLKHVEKLNQLELAIATIIQQITLYQLNQNEAVMLKQWEMADAQ